MWRCMVPERLTLCGNAAAPQRPKGHCSKMPGQLGSGCSAMLSAWDGAWHLHWPRHWHRCFDVPELGCPNRLRGVPISPRNPSPRPPACARAPSFVSGHVAIDRGRAWCHAATLQLLPAACWALLPAPPSGAGDASARQPELQNSGGPPANCCTNSHIPAGYAGIGARPSRTGLRHAQADCSGAQQSSPRLHISGGNRGNSSLRRQTKPFSTQAPRRIVQY